MKTLFQLVCGMLLISAAVPALASPVSVPEPISLSLFAVGAGSTVMVRALRRRRR